MRINNPHLLFAYENFGKRLQEVEEYLTFAKALAEIPDPVVKSDKTDKTDKTVPINRDLQKSLRATSYLLLYNLLEYAMSEAIHSIHETLKQEKLEITALSEKIHKIIVSSFKKGISESKINHYYSQENDIRDSIFELGYDKSKLFSGNIDSNIVDAIAKKYGFQPKVYQHDKQRYTWLPEDIIEVKNRRNALSHGSESFSECGQNMAIDTFTNNLNSIYAISMAVFNGVNHFLTHKKYLRNDG